MTAMSKAYQKGRVLPAAFLFLVTCLLALLVLILISDKPQDRLGSAMISGGMVVFFLLGFYAYCRHNLWLSEDGIVVESMLRKQSISWNDVASYSLSEENRVILGLRQGRPVQIILSFYRQPNLILDELSRHLGEPKIVKRWFVTSPSKARNVLIGAVLCSIPLATVVTTIGWVAGLLTGLFAGIYFYSMESRSPERRKSQHLVIWASTFFACMITCGLLGRDDSIVNDVLRVVAFFAGWISGSLGVQFLAHHGRTQRGDDGEQVNRNTPQ